MASAIDGERELAIRGACAAVSGRRAVRCPHKAKADEQHGADLVVVAGGAANDRRISRRRTHRRWKSLSSGDTIASACVGGLALMLAFSGLTMTESLGVVRSCATTEAAAAGTALGALCGCPIVKTLQPGCAAPNWRGEARETAPAQLFARQRRLFGHWRSWHWRGGRVAVHRKNNFGGAAKSRGNEPLPPRNQEGWRCCGPARVLDGQRPVCGVRIGGWWDELSLSRCTAARAK